MAVIVLSVAPVGSLAKLGYKFEPLLLTVLESNVLMALTQNFHRFKEDSGVKITALSVKYITTVILNIFLFHAQISCNTYR